jgi:flagellar basal body-associated protein FliL
MKTQKSFKKRALLSSIAMLLVATVAVGSATFAWFSSNNTATGNGINVKTAKQSNLLIKNSTGDWRTLVDYNVDDKVLLPASSVLVNDTGAAPWYTAKAPDYNTEGAKEISQITSNAAAYYFADELNIKNDGEVTVNDVTVTVGWGTDSTTSYIRAALVPMNADGSAIDTTKTPIIFSDTAKETYSALIGTASADGAATEVASVTTNDGVTFNVGSMAKGAEVYYNLYVWFEGQDADCLDSTAGAEINDISFTVTGTPASTSP